MAVDPRARRELRRKLEEVLGEKQALTLMSQLPTERPATKADIEALESRTDLKLEALEHRVIGTLRREMHEGLTSLGQETASLRREMYQGLDFLRRDMAIQARTFTFSMIGSVIAVGGLAVAAGRFA